MRTFSSFEELLIPKPLSENLRDMEFHAPTPIQAMAIPSALDGKDVLGSAQTGTGKTAAFAIPMLASLYSGHRTQGLVLAPTRELAAQIFRVMRQMGKGLKVEGALVVGGESFHRQVHDIYRGVDYIVATPGRMNDHLQERTAEISKYNFLVLDEVDRMLDMGFAPQIKRIIAHLPKERQTLLFSATLPREIEAMARSMMRSPVRAAVGAVSTPVSQVTEESVQTTREGKNSVLLAEIKKREGRILIFTRTKSRADRVAKMLESAGFTIVCLHGGRTQGQRKQALERFRKGSHRIMVATDLAGRGIDIDDIEHIINYDLPSNREDYIHRIGRSGRFGKKGSALNLLTSTDFEADEIIGGKKKVARTVFRSHRSRFGRGR